MGSNSHWNDAAEVVETEGFDGLGDNRQKFCRTRQADVEKFARFPPWRTA